MTWLHDLKPKDRVIVCVSGRNTDYAEAYVDRVTPTLVRVKGHDRPFSKKSGRRTGHDGDAWGPTITLEPWTERLAQEIQAQALRREARREARRLYDVAEVNAGRLSVAELQTLLAAITAARNVFLRPKT